MAKEGGHTNGAARSAHARMASSKILRALTQGGLGPQTVEWLQDLERRLEAPKRWATKCRLECQAGMINAHHAMYLQLRQVVRRVANERLE